MASLVQWLAFSGARKTDGTPVSTGKAYFYAPGSTSELVTVWEQSEELSAANQPVILDAGGKAEVYLSERAQILIVDSDGAEVSTIGSDSANAHNLVRDYQVEVVQSHWTGEKGGLFAEGYPTNLNSVATRIGDSIGSDAKYREALLADCVKRRVHDILHHCVRGRDYGAVGNGVVDDTVALQKAFNRAVAAGIPLYLESGTYKTSFPIFVNGSIHVYGEGPALSIINNVAATNCLSIGQDLNANVIVRDLQLKTPLATNGGLTALLCGQTNSLLVSNVWAYSNVCFDSRYTSNAKYIHCKANTVSDGAC